MFNEFVLSAAVFAVLLAIAALSEAIGKKRGKNWDLVGPFLTCWLATPVFIFFVEYFCHFDLNLFLLSVCPLIHVGIAACVSIIVNVMMALKSLVRNSRR